METNAYILDWTMNDYDRLKKSLADSGFAYLKEEGTEHIRVAVPFAQVNEFASLCKAHLSVPYNYVDVQFPHEKKTVIVFRQETFVIADNEANEKVKTWAINLGLPPEQADWSVSF